MNDNPLLTIPSTIGGCNREFSEVLRQAGFTENDHVIQALPPNGADHALDVRTLPRRSWRSQHFLNAQLFHLLGEFGTEDAVAIAQQRLATDKIELFDDTRCRSSLARQNRIQRHLHIRDHLA